MSKFTPGPWEVYIGSLRGGQDYLAVASDGLKLGQPHKVVAIITDTKSATIMDSCNARLIAAAPDLYEGLRAIEALLSDPRAGDAGRQGAINTCRALLEQADGF